VQLSAVSQTPAEARHTVVDGRKESAGHAAALPVQVSAVSQTPADARHTVVDGTNTSAGHAAPVPLQVSAVSQTPAEARHTVPAATLFQVVGPDTADDGTVHTWQLFAGFSVPLLKQTPPMRQKPSSTRPLQSLSSPSQTSGVGAPGITEQVELGPVPQITVPMRAQAPTPTVQDPPVGRHVPLQLV